MIGAPPIPLGPDWGTPPAEVLEVHDGDTIRVRSDRGVLPIHATLWLRLRNWSCPELRQPLGPAARAATLLACPVGGTVLTRTIRVKPWKVKRDSPDDQTFGRYVADIYFEDGPAWLDLGPWLAAQDLAQSGARVG